jgi:elongation factor P
VASSFETSDFRKGLKILWDGIPWVVIDFQHVKPGKGNAFTRTRLKNLLTGSTQDVTFKSGERMGDPEIEDKTMSFLYNDAEGYHFMDQRTYDQVALSKDALGDAVNFLLPEMQANVMFYNGRAINVDIPQHVVMKITYCEPGVRGDTATNVTKPATLETGAIVQVPIFLNAGDSVKVDTRTGEYLERTAIG